MAYVSVVEWRPEQVTEWLKGLDNSIVSYIHWFSNNEVNGQQLLNLTPDDLTHLGVYKLGHQELILEAVQHLRNFHYELDRENLQLLALKLSCAAHSLFSEIRDQPESSSVPTQIMADVANVIHNVKPLVSWLDRPPFSAEVQYSDFKSQLLSLSLEMATSAQRDRFAERPVAEIRDCSCKLAKLADSIIQDISNPMILQPATLDLATIKKKAGEELDFFLVPSFHGIHQIGDMKLSSPAQQSGKIQQGDEIVQVNYQTVVGWSRKKVLALFEESPNDLLLTLKRRPRHVKIYGQIYMKPYRLPSRKRSSPYSRWNDNLPSPRPELLTIPDFDTTRSLTKKIGNAQNLSLEPSGTSSSSDEEFGQPSDSQSPMSMRLFLPKPRASIQRRFTLSGPPRPSAQSEQFWRELQLERSWRSNQSNSQINNSSAQNVGSKDGNIDEIFQLRDKSASLGNSIASASSRSTACVPFTKSKIGSVKFDLSKFETFKNDKNLVADKEKALESDVNDSYNNVDSNHSDKEPNTLDSNFQPTLSITEINKIKRNAFFNNMDYTNNQVETTEKFFKEGSSDKVKQVIENFKSEIKKTRKDMSEIEILKSPGKVMELVENFEKKENLNVGNKNKTDLNISVRTSSTSKLVRDTNIFKKSVESSVKNLADTNTFVGKKTNRECEVMKETLHNFSDNDKIPLEIREKSKIDLSTTTLERTDQMKLNIKKENNFAAKTISEFDDQNKSNYEKNSEIDSKGAKNSYKNTVYVTKLDISNTSNETKSSCEPVAHSICKHTERQSPDDEPTKSNNISNNNNNNCKVSVCKGESNTQILLNSHEEIPHREPEPFKPVPAQRKSKPIAEKNFNSTLNSNPFPLPPKPRTKLPPTSLSTDSTLFPLNLNNEKPPEPPPRSDSTFLKPSNVKKNDVSLDSSNKKIGKLDLSLEKGLVISAPLATSEPPTLPLNLNPVSPTASSSKKTSKSSNALATLSSFASATGDKEKSKSSGSTLESLKAMLTLGRKPGNVNSPRSIRKKNALLAKKRNISVKEVTPHENSGFLYYRNRRGLAVASWTKYFFVLQESNFYGFKSKESIKADLFIHLPGFTCTLADEVKSKDFSFKIYHTGTVFYFAANSRENLQQWLDCINLAISFQDEKGIPDSVNFSQTDSDSSDPEPESENCFPTSPKMKKVLGSSPLPKPARSHQNLVSESKKSHEIQRRFGSLKKLSSRKNSNTNNPFPSASEPSEVASLDRKYLRFLGQKNSPTPVPTSGFRSYRRMNPTPVLPSKGGKSKNKSKALENNEESFLSSNQVLSRNPTKLSRKPLHSSNPSLAHPEMADYRVTQESLSEFRRLRNQGNPIETNRFITLEQFMQTMQEDNFRSNRNRAQELNGFITLEQFLLRQEEERQRSIKTQERFIGTNDVDNQIFFGPDYDEERNNDKAQNRSGDFSSQNVASTSNQRTNRPKKTESEESQTSSKSTESSFNAVGSQKNSTMYQSPCNSLLSSSSNQEDPMRLNFEMSFDQRNSKKSTKCDTSNLSNIECVHTDSNNRILYQGIEYPPAFEPETYTLQHMLKNRQKSNNQDSKNQNKSQ